MDVSKIKLGEETYNVKDANIPTWARASTKPTYTASEVGALPDTTVIPTATSQLTNDSGFLTSHQDISGKQDVLTAGDGIAIDSNDTVRTTGIPFGRCDSTSTATEFTATVPGIYKLEDGVCAMIENGVVTSASGFTLNVNGLGAKPCYSNLAAATRDTTLFNIAYTMLFVYDEERVEGGCWVCYRGYDSNTNTVGYQVRSNSHSLPASQKFYRYRLLFTSADGTHYVPANTSSSTNATSSRTVNQTPIDPFGHIVYYGTTAAVDANARPAAASLWIIYTLSLGYSFNKTGAALTLNDWAPVYIKCAPQVNGSAIIDETTPYVQSLPTTADGKIYIFLGIAYNTTSIELLNNHPVYYHDGTGIRLWTGKDGSSITVDDAITQSGTNPVEGGAIYTALNNKVDKVNGKDLSTNDYTTTEKNKLAGISEGAEVNV
ncbi:hypothetical protein [Lachnospira sp.]|jgi:hypothetical protein|uniref:hypothetical protein n=1 Tax=Lachnospira sp. TaxID=2049031 RepID=UPI00257E3F15|nr:hypothetical protein [Lachnospira sp.]